MKALSLKPEWAMPVLLDMKTIECRTWQTSYRGDLLICSSAKPLPGTIAGYALCVAELLGIEPFGMEHLEAACLESMPSNAYAWQLGEIKWIEPFKQKGKLNLFDVDNNLIKYLPDDLTCRECLETYYEPLLTMKNHDVSEQETRTWWKTILADF
ncbi:MAG: ASCH domain-containing protein [Raoultibacter sp.]